MCSEMDILTEAFFAFPPPFLDESLVSKSLAWIANSVLVVATDLGQSWTVMKFGGILVSLK